jgi:[ribosomal protein S5]-alanine N-acetyltransferase
VIETGSAVLRPLEPSDLDQLYEFRNDEEVTRLLAGFSTGYSRADLAAWLEAHRGRADEVLWAIATAADNRCIGHVGLYRIDHRVRKAEFAILIGDRAEHGKGIGREVSRAVLEYAFQQLNLHKVSLSVLVTNERALRLYAGLGFRRDGLIRHDQFRDGRYVDLYQMSLLEDEWRDAGA